MLNETVIFIATHLTMHYYSSAMGYYLCSLFVGSLLRLQNLKNYLALRLRPYHDEHTRSRLITEVKHRRARIVLGWGTAWEHLVP